MTTPVEQNVPLLDVRRHLETILAVSGYTVGDTGYDFRANAMEVYFTDAAGREYKVALTGAA